MKSSLTVVFFLLCTSFLVVPLTSGSASAQEQEQELYQLEEVVVTARRRSENLQDVPGAVVAITQKTIERAGIQRAADFIALVPGVTIVPPTVEVGETPVNIRGISSPHDADTSYALLINGVLRANSSALNREYLNLQQIEVFKGPQGALYGRNASGGAIIITTQKPGNEFRLASTASYGNNDSVYGAVSVSGPLIADKLFLEMSGGMRETDGFFRNVFQGNGDEAVVDRYASKHIESRMLWQPTEDITVDWSGRIGEIDAAAVAFNAAFHLPLFAQYTGIPEAFEHVSDHDFVFQSNIRSDNNQDAAETSLKVDYEMDWATLSAWGLYSDVDNWFITDSTSGAFGFFNNDPACIASTAAASAQGVALPPPQYLAPTPEGSFFGPYTPTTCDGITERLSEQTDMSFEVRLTSSGDQALQWMVGGYYLEMDRRIGVNLARDSGDEPITGMLQPSGPNKTIQLYYDDFESTVYAGFGQITYDIKENIELSFAARYDQENRKVHSLVPSDITQDVIDLNQDGLGGDPLNPGLTHPELVDESGGFPDKSRNFSHFQPKVSIRWDVTENASLYSSWGSGFKSGGFNNTGSAATIDDFINDVIAPFVGTGPGQLPVAFLNYSDDYNKEITNTAEIGIKGSAWNQRARFEAAAFYTDVENMQYFEFFAGSFGVLRVVSNIDEVKIKGLEFSGSFIVNEYLTASAGLAVFDSEIKKNTARTDTVGSTSPGTPDYTFNAAVDFQYPISDKLQLTARLDWRVVGPTWFSTVQDQARPTIFAPLFGAAGFADYSVSERDRYDILNLRLGLDAGQWRFTLYGQNITDEKYENEVLVAPDFGGSFISPGARRSYGLEVSYQY